MPEPTISVVIAAYNAESTLGGTISSVLTQTRPADEIIVVDDGSTDRTAEIARAYGERVRLVSQPNGGVSKARNTGIDAATSELIALLDSDDEMLPPYLATMVETYGGGVSKRYVTSEAYLLTAGGIDPKRTVLIGAPGPREQRMTMLQANVVSCFGVFPKAMWSEIGGYDEEMAYCEDWDFWARAVFAGWTIHFQKRPLALYRWTPGSLSTKTDKMFAGEDRLLARIAKTHSLTAEERAYLDRRLAVGSPRALEFEGDEALRVGDFATARERFTTASELMPADFRLKVKDRSIKAVPPVAKLWQRRLLAADKFTGRDTNKRQ